jgi:hypothetical protein
MIIVALLCVACSSKAGGDVEKVPMSNYTTITISGIQQQGYIDSVKVDTDAMIKDFPDLKGKVTKDSFNWKVTKGNDGLLNNDDEFCIAFSLKENKEDLTKYDFTQEVCSKVSGLESASDLLDTINFSDVLYWAPLRKEEMYQYVDQSYTYKFHCTITDIKEDGISCNLDGNTTYPVYLNINKKIIANGIGLVVGDKIIFMGNPSAKAYAGASDYYPQFDNVVFMKE